MGLRDLAALDRRNILADPDGPAEDFVYTEPDQVNEGPGVTVNIKGTWREVPNDVLATWGAGVESDVSMAWLVIALADAPSLTRAAVFERVADGTAWVVEQKELVAGVGYRLTLAKTSEATVKAAKFRGVH